MPKVLGCWEYITPNDIFCLSSRDIDGVSVHAAPAPVVVAWTHLVRGRSTQHACIGGQNKSFAWRTTAQERGRYLLTVHA